MRIQHTASIRKNLLVRRSACGWSVAAVLDWEFAAVVGPWMDLGNMLRRNP